jgi:hypothetical protein
LKKHHETDKYFIRISFLILFISSRASSITPTQGNNTLPTLIKSFYYNQSQDIKSQNNNKCWLLVIGRNYVAPIGFTVMEDLKNGAKGIDEWVKMDWEMLLFLLTING